MTATPDWTGRVGDSWAAEWRRTDRALAGLSRHLDAAIAAAAPPGPFRAVDIGAGAGATSLALAAVRPDAEVTGIDLSPALVAIARDRVGTARFVVGDAAALAAQCAPVDLFVSRHGVMFFADPVAAFAAFARAAAPGGGMVFSCFAEPAANPWSTLVASPSAGIGPGPFAFADRDRVAAILAAAGWRDAVAERVTFDYRVGAGDDPVGDAAAFLHRIGPAASLLRDAAPAERAAIAARLLDRLAAARQGDVIDYPATAWIWRARAGERA